MSRVQLAVNVSDLEAAVAFYSKLLQMEPTKRRPGYANFAVESPPLKLVLMEAEGTPGSLNHLGIEVESVAEVAAATQRLAADGLATAEEAGVDCCYAVQDKVWVGEERNGRWEVYTVLADAPAAPAAPAAACCA